MSKTALPAQVTVDVGHRSGASLSTLGAAGRSAHRDAQPSGGRPTGSLKDLRSGHARARPRRPSHDRPHEDRDPVPGTWDLGTMPRPSAGPGQVVIEVYATGICGTDLHIAADEFPSRPPVVMGHEVTGRVVEVGDRRGGAPGRAGRSGDVLLHVRRLRRLSRRPAQPLPRPEVHRLACAMAASHPTSSCRRATSTRSTTASVSMPVPSTSRSLAWRTHSATQRWPRRATPRSSSDPGPWASSARRCFGRRGRA